MEEVQTSIEFDFIDELSKQFPNLNFKRIEITDGMFITNDINRSMSNDAKLFTETQAKRVLRKFLVSSVHGKKLLYFSQDEDKDEDKIYKFDNVQNLQPNEKYVVQNIGHATQLIHISGFNILTDPVFNDLNGILYPAKTQSYPGIEMFPIIDVIILSHNHRDHVDEQSLLLLIQHHKEHNWPQPKVFVPLGDKKLLETFGFEEVEEANWYTKISVTKNINNVEKTINFISIPVDHRSGRNGLDHHKSLVTGWLISSATENVIFKYSGDTRELSSENQLAVDALIWHEVICKSNYLKNDEVEIPDIICLEPSGPNYTRCFMGITHQSSSYSALLKFLEAKNLAKVSERNIEEFLKHIHTVMMHHNKYELGPDRFNEGLFIFKKLLYYLDLSEKDLEKELMKEEEKLNQNLDKQMLRRNTSCAARPIIAALPSQTSLLVHAKDFIIKEIAEINKIGMNKEKVKYYLKNNTIFPKIGERLNNEQILNGKTDVEKIKKYRKSTTFSKEVE